MGKKLMMELKINSTQNNQDNVGHTTDDQL